MVTPTYAKLASTRPLKSKSSDLKSLLTGLKLCSRLKDLENGKRLHKQAITSGSAANIFVATALVDFYASCGIMPEAKKTFDCMPVRDVVAWNVLLLGFAENGQSHLTVELVPKMQNEGCSPNSRTYLALAVACGNLAVKETGKLVDGKLLKLNSLRIGITFHSQIDAEECRTNTILATALIDMYKKTGSMIDASQVFNKLVRKDAGSWNALITGYMENGQSLKALEIFACMRREGWKPNTRSFVAALQACRKLTECEGEDVQASRLKCMEIHMLAMKSGLATDIFVGNSLLDVYSRCGSMEEALRVFKTLLHPTVVSYTIMMQGYTEAGKSRLAVELFHALERNGLFPDARFYVAALNACTRLASECDEEEPDALKVGSEIYSKVVKSGYVADEFVSAAAIDMFAKCGSLSNAQEVFDKLQYRDSVTWNSLLLGYVEHGEPEPVHRLFMYMRQEGCPTTARTYLAVIKACSLEASESEEKAAALHAEVVLAGFHLDVYVAQALVEIYMKSGSVVRAQEVFDGMLKHDVASWTCLVLGYAENGEHELVFESFWRMHAAGLFPEGRVYIAALTACGSLATKGNGNVSWLEEGKALHSRAEAAGLLSDIFVATAVVSMYAKFGSIPEARKVFDAMQTHDVVAWNSLLLGYVEIGENELVLELLRSMDDQGCERNARTFYLGLNACAALAGSEQGEVVDGTVVKLQSLSKGMSLHSRAAESAAEGIDQLDVSVACILVEMYVRAGSLLDARKVFDCMPSHNVQLWTSIISAYAEKGEGKLALELFECIKDMPEVYPPTARAFTAALKSCASRVELEHAKGIHALVCRLDVGGVERSLVEVYGKCGSVDVAQHVSDSTSSRESGWWNALMLTYSQHGDALEVLGLFRRMQEDGHGGDETSLTCVLSACSRAGLVEEGKRCFDELKRGRYNFEPRIEHYHCMIDLLGRANLLDEAVDMIKGMPFEANEVTWMTTLSACCKWKNLEIGKMAFQSLVSMNAVNHAAYVLMANLKTPPE